MSEDFLMALSKADCCSGVSIPADITATIDVFMGECPCLQSNPTSILMHYFVNDQAWVGAGFFGDCVNGEDGEIIGLVLQCPSGEDCTGFILDIAHCATVEGISPEEDCTCDPLSIVFHWETSDPCGCSNGDVTISITIAL